jgi:hypothetical protein
VPSAIRKKTKYVFGVGVVEWECSGPNGTPLGQYADRTKDCICKPRDDRAYLDDDGSDFDCPHHGFTAKTGRK